MSTYLDENFETNMERVIDLGSPTEYSDIDFDAIIDSISASKILGGTMASNDGRTSLALDDGTFLSSDGLIDRVRLGKMDDGSYGLIIKDREGNVLFNITGETNLIQSKTGKMQIDLTEEQARWYDDLYLRIGIGKFLKKF